MKPRQASVQVHPHEVLRVVSAIEAVADDGAVQLKLDKGRQVIVQVPLEQVPWLQGLLAQRPPRSER